MTDSKLHHKHTEPWSEQRPVPAFAARAQQREEEQQARKAASDYSSDEEGPNSRFDPITHRSVAVKDLTKDDLVRAFQNLDRILPSACLDTLEEEKEEDGRRARSAFSDFPDGKSTNLLYHPLPQLDRKRLLTVEQSLFMRCALWVGAISTAITCIPSMMVRVPLLLLSIYSVSYYFAVQAKDTFNALHVDRERQRGISAAQATVPESSEWLNQILAHLWPLIDPEIFSPAKNLLEDIMQQNVPSMISMVKVVDINQGQTPMRVLSMRVLPQAESGEDDFHPEEEEEDDRVGSRINLWVTCGIHISLELMRL